MTYQYPKFRGPLNPEELNIRKEQDVAERQRKLKALEDLALSLGYNRVDKFSDLELTKDEIKTLAYIRESKEDSSLCRYFVFYRTDGKRVKVLAEPWAKGYGVDIFSPAFTGGHAGNHDSSEYDMNNLLSHALT